jgi:hypothetical protein
MCVNYFGIASRYVCQSYTKIKAVFLLDEAVTSVPVRGVSRFEGRREFQIVRSLHLFPSNVP